MFVDILIEVLFVLVFVLFVMIEWWLVKIGCVKGWYEIVDVIISMVMGIGNVIIGILIGVVGLWILLLVWLYCVMIVLVIWWIFLIIFVLYDLVYYWKYCFMYWVCWFWMEYVIYYFSKYYNLMMVLRQFWFGFFIGIIIVSWLFVLIGFYLVFIGFVGGINLVYQFWIYIEVIDKCLCWFEVVFNIFSYYWVYYVINLCYFDVNYVGVFIIWDKMFGLFILECEDDMLDYGIVKLLNMFNLILVVYYEFIVLVCDCVFDGLCLWIWIWCVMNVLGWSLDGYYNCMEEFCVCWLVECEMEIILV